jgi:toxin YoeB
VSSLEFDPIAFEDFAWWIEQDRKKAMKIIKLIREIQRNPYSGIGDPEQLKHELVGCWSRRIDQEHRLVYQVLENEGKIRILACRYHYSKHQLA